MCIKRIFFAILIIFYNLSMNAIELSALIAGTPMLHTVMCHVSKSFDDYKIFSYPYTQESLESHSLSNIIIYLSQGKINNGLRSCFNAFCLAVNLYFLYKSYTINKSDMHKIYIFSAVMFHVVQLTTMPTKDQSLNVKVNHD